MPSRGHGLAFGFRLQLLHPHLTIGRNNRRVFHRAGRPQTLVFIHSGHFDFIAAAIGSRLQQTGALPSDRAWRVLEAGCGTGHHLARIAAELGSSVVGLGRDIAATAARRAARRWPGLAFAVTDLWSDWPVQDAALDIVISIFAPKNFRETARVLRPGGCFALVYPRANHLVELRQRYALMRHHKDKAERYAGAVSRMIGPPTVVRLVGRTFLDPAAVRDVVLMVPAARHITPLALDATTEPMAVTFDVSVLLACKAGSSAGRKR